MLDNHYGWIGSRSSLTPSSATFRYPDSLFPPAVDSQKISEPSMT